MILYLTDDLMFSSQILSAAQNAGFGVEWKPTESEFMARWVQVDESERTSIAILDLGMRNVNIATLIAALKSTRPNCQLIGYGPHVQVDRLAEAQRAGCDVVLARGAFSREVVSVLTHLSSP